MNPKQMQQAMKQMGLETEELKAKKVVIDLGETELVFTQPEIVKMAVKGNTMFQLSGNYEEREKGPSQEDVELVMEKADVSEADARAALAETDDIAEAIMQLQG